MKYRNPKKVKGINKLNAVIDWRYFAGIWKHGWAMTCAMLERVDVRPLMLC